MMYFVYFFKQEITFMQEPMKTIEIKINPRKRILYMNLSNIYQKFGNLHYQCLNILLYLEGFVFKRNKV